MISDHPQTAEGAQVFDCRELDWFIRNAYNLGTKNTESWHPLHVAQMLASCIDIIKQYPPDAPATTTRDLSLKGLFCHFVCGSALVSVARTEDDIDNRLLRYQEAQTHIESFDTELQTILPRKDGEVKKDLLGKLGLLLMFRFEIAIAQNEWTLLGEIARKAKTCDSIVPFQGMADCLIRAQAPYQGMASQRSRLILSQYRFEMLTSQPEFFSVMCLLVDEIWALEPFQASGLVMYYRVLLQVMIGRDRDLAYQIVERCVGLANESSEVRI